MTYPKLAALAVVVREKDLLLVRRKNEPDAGKWGFPGGHVDFGERAADAACRELLEETTVCAKPSQILTGLDVIMPGAQGDTEFHYYLVAVKCDYVRGDPQARDDVSDARWISHRDVFEQNIELSKDVDTVLGLALRAGSQEGLR